jgi:arginase
LDNNIELIEVLSDLGAGIHGSGFGSAAIRRLAGTQYNSDFSRLGRSTIYKPVSDGFGSYCAKNIESVLKINRSISNVVCASINKGNSPIIISGDHSNAAGTIAGIKMAKPNSVLGVIWIDAHADLHSPYTTPSGNMHGMPLAASIAEDNAESAVREIDSVTSFFWREFKNIGNISPKIQPQNIVYISLRDYEDEEYHLIRKRGIINYDAGFLINKGIENVVNRIFDQLEHCTDIYISFDVDCLDPLFSKGTGLPVQGGLLPGDAELLTGMLLGKPRVICMEVTEYNPFLDIDKRTAGIVYNILEKGVWAINNRSLELRENCNICYV